MNINIYMSRSRAKYQMTVYINLTPTATSRTSTVQAFYPRVFFTAGVNIRRSSRRLGAGVESTIEVAGIP